MSDTATDISALFDTIIEQVAVAPNDETKPLRMQIANLAYDSYVGRMGIGRVVDGQAKVGQQVTIVANDGTRRTGKISKVMTSLGLKKIEVDAGTAGDIITIAGIPDIYVGETVCGEPDGVAMPAITVDAPTLTMEFMVNDSPFAGKEGKFVTSR